MLRIAGLPNVLSGLKFTQLRASERRDVARRSRRRCATAVLWFNELLQEGNAVPLTCGCDDGDHDWYFCPPEDYSQAPDNAPPCSSCKQSIAPGSIVAKFERIDYDEDGEELWSDVFFCEPCADLYFSFSELGFACIDPTENMMGLAKEYAETYGQHEGRK